MPIKPGTWPTAMLSAEPVIKAEMAAKEMKSTIQPARIRPMKVMMLPAIIARAEAMTCPGMLGSVFATFVTTLPTMVDITATGYTVSRVTRESRARQLTPMVMSFDVAKNQ